MLTPNVNYIMSNIDNRQIPRNIMLAIISLLFYSSSTSVLIPITYTDEQVISKHALAKDYITTK